ncbi:MAG: hypothetical protein OHK0012_08650 [Synechococcales cyanobacterium]
MPQINSPRSRTRLKVLPAWAWAGVTVAMALAKAITVPKTGASQRLIRFMKDLILMLLIVIALFTVP